MPTDHAGPLEPLGSEECRRLLTAATLGRLAFTDGAMPAIAPVRFVADDDCVYIPARLGDPLVSAVRGAVVALQVDSYRDDIGPGWSVTAIGPSHVLTDPSALTRITRLGLPDGGAHGDACCIGVRPGLIRGWRTGVPAASGWTSSSR